MRRKYLFLLLLLSPGFAARAQNLDVEEFTLDNGMKFLLVPRKGEPNVSAGWVAKIGSVNEHPGVTGIAHLFEHMMFKGTPTIGIKDAAKEAKLTAELDQVRADIEKEEQRLIERKRRGEIEDTKDPKNRTPHHQELLTKFQGLEAELKSLIVKDEFDRIYTGSGAVGMNASTGNDQTTFYIRVPANKLELWFWMESDRLLNPVFREFYSERDVVHEERRLRTDSTPTGKFREQFDSLFWQSSPYSWPVVGWPSDLEAITREDALGFYSIYYAPNNLTACIVGDFDVPEAKRLAKLYFGRLKHGARDPEPVRTTEMPQLAEERMTAYAETNPSVTIRYHSVADGHADEPALVLLASLLNGQTGRLHKSLVIDQKIATQASGNQAGLRFEGYFEFNGTAREGHTPEEVEKAIYAEIEKLKSEPVSEHELQKVKNRELVSQFRRVQSDFALMFELLSRDVARSWKSIKTDPPLYQAVTAEDITRVAKKYFPSDLRTVAIYYRKDAQPPGEDGAKKTPPATGKPSRNEGGKS